MTDAAEGLQESFREQRGFENRTCTAMDGARAGVISEVGLFDLKHLFTANPVIYCVIRQDLFSCV